MRVNQEEFEDGEVGGTFDEPGKTPNFQISPPEQAFSFSE